MTRGRGGEWNRAGRRSGGSRPVPIVPVPPRGNPDTCPLTGIHYDHCPCAVCKIARWILDHDPQTKDPR